MDRCQKKKTSLKQAEPDEVVSKNTLAEAAGIDTRFDVGDKVKVDYRQTLSVWERIVKGIKSMAERKPKIHTKPQYSYGVVKWVGHSINHPDCFLAGVEMENVVEGGHSGKSEGRRYFTCKDGHGLILPLSCLQHDDRIDLPLSTRENKEEHTVSHYTQRPTARGCVTHNPNMNIFRERYIFGISPQIELGHLFVTFPKDIIANSMIEKIAKNYEDEIRHRVLTWLSYTAKCVIILGDKHNREFTLLLLVHAIRLNGELPTNITQSIEIPNRRISDHCKQAVECFTYTDITINKCQRNNKVLSDSDDLIKCHITGPEDQIEKAKEMIHIAMKGDEIANAEFTVKFRKIVGDLIAEGYNFSGQLF